MAAACQQAGSRQEQGAQRFGVSVSFIKKLLRRQRQTGSLAAKPANGRPLPSLAAEDQAWLVAYVGQHADTTLAELGHAWQCYSGRTVGQTCLWHVLDEHGLWRKKSLSASERDTPRVKQTGRSMCRRHRHVRIAPGFTSSTKRACA